MSELAPAADAARSGRVTERLNALLGARGGGPPVALTAFARALLSPGTAYTDALSEEATAALVAEAFGFLAAPGAELRARVVAVPAGDATVVETVMPDRPFIVDTVREWLRREGLPVQALLHPILAVRRGSDGALESLGPPEGDEPRESFLHVVLGCSSDAGLRDRLAASLLARLEDVRLITDDFAAMVARAQTLAAELDALGRNRASRHAAEASAVADFVRWLVDGSVIFLGYREYELTSHDGVRTLGLRAGSGLGLLRREERSGFLDPHPVDGLPATVRARLFGGRLLTVAKSRAESPIHRLVPMDDIGLRALDPAGEVVGERRFLGLFTSKANTEESAGVPLLRRTLRQVLRAEGALAGSHDHKEIVSVFNALPKSELLASSPEDVRGMVRTVLGASRSGEVVVRVRPNAAGRRVSVLVLLPPGRFADAVRVRIRALVTERLGGPLLDDHLDRGEDERALLHLAVPAEPASVTETLHVELRAAIEQIVRTWEERLHDALLAAHGEAEGERLAARFAGAFPEDYQAGVGVERAAADVAMLADVEGSGAPLARFEAARGTTVLHLYQAGVAPVLSECIPLLEHLGLRALASDEVAVRPAERPPLFIQSFRVTDRGGAPIDVEADGARLVEALLAVRAGRADDDVLNGLVLGAGLDWRSVACLRTFCAYAVQVGLARRPMALATLAAHPEPSRRLFACFAARFRPEPDADPAAVARAGFLESLDGVGALREDLLLRALLDVVEATVRTTFFTRAPDRDDVALKIRAASLARLAEPRPLYEVFVHAPTVEGIHLRAGRIARGGLRHSDRPEDFRTEVLGLMRTQTVKNAVIVPDGAKGAFVVRGPERGADRVLAAYRTFIRALLDLTDNTVGGRVVHPRGMVIHDEADPYLVVAADKGTATFSDVANALAEEAGFWLGDGFASGGSHGYDHKVLGITARGAWESVRTHFREQGIDADHASLAVVGIGDMSGDVFGNGLLRSPHLRLRAAFDHRHVFLDPEPDAPRAFAERSRLFEARLGWDGYDPAVLSAGGLVVSRAAKRVPLSSEAAAMLGLAGGEVSGERLVQAVLSLDADLLFNGGIGTYVRASDETDRDARDALNDPVRVTAAALGARVVAEGGNLGLTQRARVELALRGGRVNTDAIDNAAGVGLSDAEVNLKICLRPLVDAGTLDAAGRDRLLEQVREEVTARVLAHTRAQSRLLGLDQVRSRTRLVDFREHVAELERAGRLHRAREGLPDRDALRARRGTLLGLTRPELAVLTAHTKIGLRDEVLASSLPEDPLLRSYLVEYFPALVGERYPDAIRAHPLAREIVATELVNALVDQMGTTFVFRVTRDTGVTVAEAVRAWAIAWAVVGAPKLLGAIARGGYAFDVETTCLLTLERTVERVTKWVLANTVTARPAADVAAELSEAVAHVRAELPDWVAGAEAEAFHQLRSELEIAGLGPPLARHLATSDWLAGVLDVITVAGAAGVEPGVAARAYYGLGEVVDFAWLWARLAEAGEEDRWQRRAVEGLIEDMLDARRRLAAAALGGDGDLPARSVAVLQALTRDLRAAPRVSLAALQVVVRSVWRLANESGSPR